MHIVYVSDGKAGHRSQALGLYQAIQRQQPHATFQEISIDNLAIFSLFKAILFKTKFASVITPPQYILGVGSHTHLRVWLMGQVYPTAQTVILMKPSLLLSGFDFVVVPQHDGLQATKKIVVTQGALNPLRNEGRHQKGTSLILLGGSSKRHQWNDEKVINQIRSLLLNNPEEQFLLTTSRRTPQGFLDLLKQQKHVERLQIFPVEETPPGWLFEQLQSVENVWVTEDSVSMIYEALTAGCRVGVLDIDRIKEDRITQSVANLVHQGFIAPTLYVEQLPHPPALKEADAVATYLLTH